MRWLPLMYCLLVAVYAQGKLRLGKGYNQQGQLVGADTVFQLQTASPLSLWLEARFASAPAADTLWAVVRSAKKPAAVFILYRSKASRNLYRGRVIFRNSGIYFVFVCLPRQSRPVLALARVYITDAQAPTPSALRAAQSQQVATSSSKKPSTGQQPISTAGQSKTPTTSKATGSEDIGFSDPKLDDIEIPTERLLTQDPLPSVEDEDLGIDDDDIQIDLPEGLGDEEEIDLEDIDSDEL
ncbi:MAG: hypothetical protein NZZ60_02015 [Bacteroidia bacterium]|nr:hypothetical protein [Bacteroidia bacterium]MCX7652945.1 hypothetical protein [Bacteroidia bacterium]